MEGIGFWDIVPLVYLVGLVLAFVLIHDRLCRPECYRIPLAMFFAIFWPLIIVLGVCIGIILLIEWVLNAIRNFILAGRE